MAATAATLLPWEAVIGLETHVQLGTNVNGLGGLFSNKCFLDVFLMGLNQFRKYVL